MRIRKTIFGRIKAQPNTFIGGVGTTITSAAALAAKIGISSTRIKGFKVVGSDIECNISGNYNLPTSAFKNNTDITYYKDNDRLVQGFANSVFDGSSNLHTLELYGLKTFSNGGLPKIRFTKIEKLYFPEMTIVQGNNSVTNNNLLTSIDIPNATSSYNSNIFYNNPLLSNVNITKVKGNIGLNSRNNSWFSLCAIGCIINVNIDMLTNNGGSPDEDLTVIKSQRNAVINFYDDSGNYVSTL